MAHWRASRRSPRCTLQWSHLEAPAVGAMLVTGHEQTAEHWRERWRQWHSVEILRLRWGSATRMPFHLLLRVLLNCALLPPPFELLRPRHPNGRLRHTCVLRGTLPLLVCTHPCRVPATAHRIRTRTSNFVLAYYIFYCLNFLRHLY